MYCDDMPLLCDHRLERTSLRSTGLSDVSAGRVSLNRLLTLQTRKVADTLFETLAISSVSLDQAHAFKCGELDHPSANKGALTS